MPCDRERLSAWFDGALPDEESRELESHLEACPTCRRWIEELEGLAEVGRDDEAPLALDDELVRRVLAACPEAPAPGIASLWRSFWNCRLQVPLPALTLALLLLVLLLGREGTSMDRPSLENPIRDARLARRLESKEPSRRSPIRTVLYDPHETEGELPGVAAPPPPPWVSPRPRGRWVVLEENYEGTKSHEGRIY